LFAFVDIFADVLAALDKWSILTLTLLLLRSYVIRDRENEDNSKRCQSQNWDNLVTVHQYLRMLLARRLACSSLLQPTREL